jgi:hypothetical protein
MNSNDKQPVDVAVSGDELLIDGTHLGDRGRTGTILEVLHGGDVVHFRVKWDDGHESIYYPGVDAHVIHAPA